MMSNKLQLVVSRDKLKSLSDIFLKVTHYGVWGDN